MRIVGFKRRLCVSVALALPATVVSNTAAQCELVKLEDEPRSTSLMGLSVGIQGHRVVAGAPAENGTGAVYVCRREGPHRWVREARLLANDSRFGDGFGWSAAIDADYVVAGAHYAGAAYVFRRSAGEWQQEAKLTAGDEGAGFGRATDIAGDRIVVGAADDDYPLGSAYVFRREAGVWVQEAKLISSDRPLGSLFGVWVAIDGDRVVVATFDPQHRCVADVFRREGTTWHHEARLTGSDRQPRGFGMVSISGDRVIQGAPGQSSFGEREGAAYVFRRDGAEWVEEAKLTASDPTQDGLFGESVAIDADQLVVGRSKANRWTGAAYVFKLDGGAWTEQIRLTASDGYQGGRFGVRVALDGNRVVAGAPNFPSGSNAASYVFAVSGDANGNGIVDECELGDLNCDGHTNALDIEPFILALFDPAEYELQYPGCDINLADINDDGVVNASDIEGFIELLFAS